MSDSAILTTIVTGAVLALAGIVALVRRRRSAGRGPAELSRLLQHAAASAPVPDAVSLPALLSVDTPASAAAARPGNVPNDPNDIIGLSPPASGTVELLPGRLESSIGGRHEIRFVRTPGVTRYTLGRGAGDERGHVQLRTPTTSRLHAYMVLENGRWRIGNLSETNPVVVNGAPLAPGAEHWLEDDDRLELGEAAYTFRQPGAPAGVLSPRPADGP
jgi:hypothetical protein